MSMIYVLKRAAKACVQEGCTTAKECRDFCVKNSRLPNDPPSYYSKQWKGWDNFIKAGGGTPDEATVRASKRLRTQKKNGTKGGPKVKRAQTLRSTASEELAELCGDEIHNSLFRGIQNRIEGHELERCEDGTCQLTFRIQEEACDKSVQLSMQQASIAAFNAIAPDIENAFVEGWEVVFQTA